MQWMTRAAVPVLVLAGAALAAPAPAQQDSSTKQPTVPQAAAPVYKPPLRGAPGGRIGGGTRGAGGELFVLSVLAPDHSALTTSAQPALYWFASRPSTGPVEVTVVDPRATEPLLEVRLEAPVPAGIHGLRLADHRVRLEPGVAYRWYVAVVQDQGRRSRDLLAGGAIERVEPPADLAARIAQAGREQAPALYAEAGVWYDALRAINELIDAAPGDAGLRAQRAAMLAQVGLPRVEE
jgi:hypothetical protein